jgi:hypothetical protein
MRTFICAILLACLVGYAEAQVVTPAAASDARTARLERTRGIMQKAVDAQGVKDTVVLEDTGKDLDIGAGPGPLIIMKLPKIGRECLVTLHPTDEDQMATLGCDDVAPTTGV